MTFSLFPQNFISLTSETIQNCLVTFYLTSSNSVQQTQTLVSTKTPAVRALKLLVFISYLVLALKSAVTNLPNISSISLHFPGLQIELLKFHDFPGLPLTIRTLRVY